MGKFTFIVTEICVGPITTVFCLPGDFHRASTSLEEICRVLNLNIQNAVPDVLKYIKKMIKRLHSNRRNNLKSYVDTSGLSKLIPVFKLKQIVGTDIT